MLWFKMIKKLINILQSEISPTQIAAGVSFGAIMGLAPFAALHTYLVFLLVLLLKVNIGSAMFAAAFFGVMGFFTDPLADTIGYSLLTSVNVLEPLWVNLYNMPVVPFTRFYNTVVLGNFVISLVLFVPVFLFTLWFVKYYRANLRERVGKWKIMKWMKLSTAYKIYDKYNG